MIYIDKFVTEIPGACDRKNPNSLWGKELKKIKVQLESFEHHQRVRFTRLPHIDKDVREYLHSLFHDKCAYCEHKIYRSNLYIDQFRPKGGVMDERTGERFPLHYWWLAGEWSNLYPVCPSCDRAKANRFPIMGKRAKEETFDNSLLTEQPLLLDPSNPNDNHSEHLLFSEDGMVYSDTEKGITTITVLKLNREDLVTARRSSAEVFIKELNIMDLADALTDEVIDDKCSDKEEFAMLKRQVYFERFKEKRRTALSSESEILKNAEGRGRSYSKIKKVFNQKLQSSELFVLDNDEGKKHFRLEGIAISRIIISNIGPIAQADIKLNQTELNKSGWLMLLGENSCGKSTILKSVAVALAGKNELLSYQKFNRESYKSFYKHNSKSKFAYVRVYIEGQNRPREVRFYPSGKVEFINSEVLSTVLLAYGSTRLSKKDYLGNRKENTSLCNLFDPFETLVHAETWLYHLDKKKFDYFTTTLIEVLNLNKSTKFKKERGKKIVANVHGNSTSLEHLSDGYKSVITLYCDIASSMYSLGFEATEDCRGVVLIDEIGVHLHPSWKMKIVASLRIVFPQVQFICSTHEPLCLRGLEDGEISVLTRSKRGKVSVNQELPSVKGMRVDQLLTSSHFGLNSTIDPEIDELFSAYYDLLAKGENITDFQRNKLVELKGVLSSHGVLSGILGYTRRDQMMYQIIDEVIANKTQFLGSNFLIDNDVKNKISAIWNNVKESQK